MTPEPSPEVIPVEEPVIEEPMVEEPEDRLSCDPIYIDDRLRDMIATQIAIEAEGCEFEVKCMIAQCIYDRTVLKIGSDGTVESTLTWPGQFDYRGNYRLQQSDYDAISWVFDQGNRVTEEPIIFFCNPDLVSDAAREWFYSFKLITEGGGMAFFSHERIS